MSVALGPLSSEGEESLLETLQLWENWKLVMTERHGS